MGAVDEQGRPILVQPKFTAFPEVDGPLAELLRDSTNVSAWLRMAATLYMKAWPVVPERGDALQFRACLRRDVAQDIPLIDYWESLSSHRRKYFMRNAGWYFYGRMSVGHELDVEALARAIVGELRRLGVQSLDSSPAPMEEAIAEAVTATLFGQFVV